MDGVDEIYDDETGKCHVCGSTDDLFACGGCRTGNSDWDYVYCGRECQRTHWREHKPFCGANDTVLPYQNTPGIPVRIVKRPDGFKSLGRGECNDSPLSLGMIAVVSKNEEHLPQLKSVHTQMGYPMEQWPHGSVVCPGLVWAAVTMPIHQPESIEWDVAETVFDGQKHCALHHKLPDEQMQHLLARPEMAQVGSYQQGYVTVPIVEVSRFGRGTPNTT